MATREAYGSALAKLATSHSKVVALDGDMKNSTFSQNIKKVDENRYIECFICEQNLIGVGIGVACRDRTIAFASTFACFLTRAFDNLRITFKNVILPGRKAMMSRSTAERQTSPIPKAIGARMVT